VNLLEFRTAFWATPVNGSHKPGARRRHVRRNTRSFTVGGRRVKSKYKLTTAP